ncbi:smad nuclear-interacting protein 1 isoform X2 [Pectinophora gossypiella]|uniref:smad nuclear-interacting protein 1 isoform X2 n=1 Tax=Pectinophora gossypiella TaxID=13191 RepID=UPI00214F0B6C|nr:smad nuclear-interacting protein 1 isoform X2 [Pectinophora gossypiella]
MKSKKRHQSSSEESEESDASIKSSSTSGSESDDSSESEHRHKKKRKRADSTDSESDSDDQKRTKKRKHKKKKKKHGKKKRRTDSVESLSVEEISMSEGEISSKKKRKHKHKHSKRARSSSASEDEEHVERRLNSVVKERRASSEEGSQPSRTYYQREYRQSGSGDEPEYDREREVQRFYRGSSKERSHQYAERYQYDRERTYKNQRYEERRPPEEYHGRPREETYHPREDTRGYNHNRYNQYEERGPKRNYDDGREYRERRPPPEQDRYREREYPEKRDRFQEKFSPERTREVRRERPARPDKPPMPAQRENSRSPEDRYRERNRRPEVKEEEPRFREGRGNERREARDVRDPKREARSPHEAARRERPPRGDERPPVKAEPKPRERKSRFGPEDNKEYSWGKTEVKKEGSNAADKEKPNFGLSGKLTADANTVNGVVIKYTEPDDAKQPKRRWRFYPFKGDKALPILYIHRQSAFLMGRDKKVVDIMLEHPSVSKQHAALQYRATPFTRPDGSQGRRVRPYIIDLDSANGTFVNNKKIEPRRYVELLERDVVKFGFSQREYVLLHENSKDDAQDDDNQEPTLGAAVTTTDQIKQDKRVKQEVAEDGE